jgi:hypothetical protein
MPGKNEVFGDFHLLALDGNRTGREQSISEIADKQR